MRWWSCWGPEGCLEDFLGRGGTLGCPLCNTSPRSGMGDPAHKLVFLFQLKSQCAPHPGRTMCWKQQLQEGNQGKQLSRR